MAPSDPFGGCSAAIRDRWAGVRGDLRHRGIGTRCHLPGHRHLQLRLRLAGLCDRPLLLLPEHPRATGPSCPRRSWRSSSPDRRWASGSTSSSSSGCVWPARSSRWWRRSASRSPSRRRRRSSSAIETILSAPGLAPEPVRVFDVLGVAVTMEQVIVYICVVLIVVVGVGVLRYTDIGLRVRAMVDSPAMTSLSATSPGSDRHGGLGGEHRPRRVGRGAGGARRSGWTRAISRW